MDPALVHNLWIRQGFRAPSAREENNHACLSQAALRRSATRAAARPIDRRLMAERARALDLLSERVLSTRAAIGEAWPYHADPGTGAWTTTDDGDWCAGHWIECLRIVGERSNNLALIEEARERTERVRAKLERDDVFRGHRFYYSAARLWQMLGDRDMRTLALAAAYAVRSMAIPANGAMPIGTQVQVESTTLAGRTIVAVDNVHPALILDWWALKETGDETFADGARAHLDATIADFIRPDGSTVEFIDYHPRTGEVLREFTLLGAHDRSCWSRGQAWAIAGLLRAWEALGEPRYLAAARTLFDYWWARVGDDRVPPYDFLDADLPDVPVDTSASTIVVEQLARLSVLDPLPAEARPFVARLEPMLDGLCRHLTPLDANDARPHGMLLDGCFNRPKHLANRHELLWGDAYLLMALSYLESGRAPD
jgi:unsaturated chondroitin disaccharide hydrolase